MFTTINSKKYLKRLREYINGSPYDELSAEELVMLFNDIAKEEQTDGRERGTD